MNAMTVGFLLGLVTSFALSLAVVFLLALAGTHRRRPVPPPVAEDTVVWRIAASRLGMRPDGRLAEPKPYQPDIWGSW